jgi:membrane associated rhomboid family serine protease
MLIPYSTDAPVYYWPIATVGLIVANVLVFFVVVIGQLVPPDNCVLWYGNGLHPDQWLSSIFMHAGPGHLIGNMLFLWLFGLVVEGKLGWWRFLCCYLAIGVGESMIEQMVMLGTPTPEPGSLGASAAIFGLIAMATIWAPLNEITFFYWIAFYVGTFDISIAWMAGLYAGWEVLMLCIFGTDAGGSWMHLAGFVMGLPLATVLLKRGIVDCEGWDAFTVWSGNYGGFREEPKLTQKVATNDVEKTKKEEQLLIGAKQQFQKYLHQGNVEAAVRLFEKMKPVRGGLAPDRRAWLAMIQWLHVRKRWSDSAPYIARCIAAYPDNSAGLRIKLAQICVVELSRPGKALELLAGVDDAALPEKQATLANRIRAKARQMQDEGVVELDVDTW